MAIMDNRRDRSLPENWYQGIEKARDKARGLIGQLVAVDQNTSVVVGRLSQVEIDTLWKLRFPYTRLTLQKPLRYTPDGRMELKLGETELFFVNKIEMVMTVAELAKRFPKIYEEILVKIKRGQIEGR